MGLSRGAARGARPLGLLQVRRISPADPGRDRRARDLRLHRDAPVALRGQRRLNAIAAWRAGPTGWRGLDDRRLDPQDAGPSRIWARSDWGCDTLGHGHLERSISRTY